jgi:uncharacterized membrane protein YidH (DUF202 family)
MKKPEGDHFLFDEIQLILAEKRTSLSTLRTGIAIFALPLSVLSVLIATSRYYDPYQVMSLLVTLLVLNLGLIVLGVYLIFRALKRIHHYDFLIREIKRKHSVLSEYLE